MADAPRSGSAHPVPLLVLKSREAQVGRLVGSRTDVRTSSKCHVAGLATNMIRSPWMESLQRRYFISREVALEITMRSWHTSSNVGPAVSPDTSALSGICIKIEFAVPLGSTSRTISREYQSAASQLAGLQSKRVSDSVRYRSDSV